MRCARTRTRSSYLIFRPNSDFAWGNEQNGVCIFYILHFIDLNTSNLHIFFANFLRRSQSMNSQMVEKIFWFLQRQVQIKMPILCYPPYCTKLMVSAFSQTSDYVTVYNSKTDINSTTYVPNYDNQYDVLSPFSQTLGYVTVYNSETDVHSKIHVRNYDNQYNIISHDKHLMLMISISTYILISNVIKYVYYYRNKWHFFFFDFCYTVNAISLVFSMLLITSKYFEGKIETINVVVNVIRKCHLMSATGPVLCAIFVWGQQIPNRFPRTMEDFDLITSAILHWLPAALAWADLWICNSSPLNITYMFWCYGILYYVGWQLLYILIVEAICRRNIKEDKELATSVRWLYRNKTGAVYKISHCIGQKLAFVGTNEILYADSLKTKLLFWGLQFIYTILATSFAWMILSARSYVLHTSFLAYMLIKLWRNGRITNEHDHSI